MFAARCRAARAPSHGRLPSDQGGTAWHPEISYSPLSLCRSPRALGRAPVTKQVVCRGHSGPCCVLACSLLQATAQPSCRRPLSVAHEVSPPGEGAARRALCATTLLSSKLPTCVSHTEAPAG